MGENGTLGETVENAAENAEQENVNAAAQDANGTEEKDTGSEELLKVKADYARLKAALDKATKEAGDARKALRAKQSAEEIAAEEQKQRDEEAKKELDELRREVARARTVKTVMGKLGTDEDTSGKIAEYLYGAEDAEAALTEMQKVLAAREKALRLEFGRIPAPAAGSVNGEDEELQRALKLAKELGRERADTGKTIRDSLGSYMR